MLNDPLFISTIAALATVSVAKSMRGAARSRAVSRGEVAQLTEQLDHHAAALENAELSLERQQAQLAEMQERLDFAERMLVQYRDRVPVGAGAAHE
jgi:hypothetical protein